MGYWHVWGNAHELAFSFDKVGRPEITGVASHHKPKPSGGDFRIRVLERLENAQCHWSIHNLDELPETVFLGNADDRKRLMDSSDSPSCAIQFSPYCEEEEKPDLVGITIIMPPMLFQRTAELLKMVLQDVSLEYKLTLKFLGFAPLGVDASFPSIDEFMSEDWYSRAYLSEEIAVKVYRRTIMPSPN